MRRWWLIPGLAVGVAAIGGALFFHYGDHDERRDPAKLRTLRAQHEYLHERLEQVLEGAPLLGLPELRGGDVVVAIRTEYLDDVVREVSRRYLERVSLDLGGIHAHEQGELKKGTFLGDMKLGDWRVGLEIARLQGTLGGHSPDLEIGTGNTVKITMPVNVIDGRGVGELHFSWNATSLVNVVCHDFEVREELAAVVMPAQYRLRGSFSIAAEGDEIVARPLFHRDKYRIRIDLTPESWAKVRAALDAQDTVGKCGLAMNPDQVMPQLHALVQKGFDVRLPASLFRKITLPAGLHSKVEVQGAQVQVDLTSRLLRLTPEILWYGASINGRVITPAASPSPASRAPSPRPTS